MTTKEEKIRLVLSTTSSNENYNGDCDYAFVELEKEDIEVLLKYRNLFQYVHDRTTYDIQPLPSGKKLGSLVTIEFWDNSVQYFSAVQKLPRGKEPAWGTGILRVRKEWSPDEDHVQRMECGCVQIWEDHVRWTAIVKHTDTHIETDRVTFEDLEKMLKEIS
jgi:hypothetical protein